MPIKDMQSNLPEGVRILDGHPSEDFYQHGSRFYGTERESSDWDFFAIYSIALLNWLVKKGFQVLSHYDTKDFDALTQTILEHRDGNVPANQITQVCLIKPKYINLKFHQRDALGKYSKYPKERRGDAALVIADTLVYSLEHGLLTSHTHSHNQTIYLNNEEMELLNTYKPNGATSCHKIKAIKSLRARYLGMGLKEAKDLVEAYLDTATSNGISNISSKGVPMKELLEHSAGPLDDDYPPLPPSYGNW